MEMYFWIWKVLVGQKTLNMHILKILAHDTALQDTHLHQKTQFESNTSRQFFNHFNLFPETRIWYMGLPSEKASLNMCKMRKSRPPCTRARSHSRLCSPLIHSTVNVLKFCTSKCLTKWHMQIVQTQIRLLFQEQSDQGLHCLPFH